MADEELQRRASGAVAMERKLTLKPIAVTSPSSSSPAANGSASALYTSGRSLLNDALSPSGKQILQDFLTETAAAAFSSASDDEDATFAHERHHQSQHERHQRLSTASSSSMYSLPRHGHGRSQSVLSNTVFALDSSRSFVQIQCNTRPFCLKLAEKRNEMVVVGFAPDLRSGVQKGVIESSGLVLPGDVLVAVNDEMDALTSVQTTVDALMDAQLPAVLTFRRLPVVKAKLGEYTVADIERNLSLRGSALLDSHSLEDAALLVKAAIEVLEHTNTSTPLMTYVGRVEKILKPPPPANTLDEATRRLHIERIQQLMQSIYKVVELHNKEQLRKWNAVKSSNFKRIDIMSKQRASIEKKLEIMRANPSLLNPDNHEIWQEYVELRHLSNQMRESVEKAKREHFLPDFEDYSLRIGNDGIYVGIGDVWIPSFYAKFTVETRSTAPHVFFHLSTPATHGLKLRAKNFTLSTEGRLPSFHCDELNIEAQVIADVPLVYDAIDGWSVPLDELHVKLMSLAYYERQANSTKKGQNHDTVMKMLINRLLPSIVRHAAQNLLCGELGPLLESRNAQVFLSGEIKIQGKKLSLYDVSLDAQKGEGETGKERALAEEARGMMYITKEDAATLYTVFKTLTELPSAKKKTPFGFTAVTEPKKLSIRSLQNYFEQFKAFPHLKALACELWSQMVELLSSSLTAVEEEVLSFPHVFENMEVLSEFPVDVSVSLLDLTFRLDLCEGAATYYTSLQRIIRQEMDSVSVGLSNLDSMRDGTFLENQLAVLDEQYEKINKLLAYITANVDDFGSVFRGGMPAGFKSKLFLEATDLACKGPCGGTFVIPLTDLAQLHSNGGVDVDESQAPASKDFKQQGSKAMTSALTHENGALVFSKFFLQDHQRRQKDTVNGNEEHDDETSSSTGEPPVEPILPSDRLQVRVKNTSAKVLFEMPTAEELSRLESASQSTTSFVPFSFSLVTNDGDEPPQIRVETGRFAKCQYKAEQIAASGSVWQFVKRTEESAGHVLHPQSANTGGVVGENGSSTSEVGSDQDPGAANGQEVSTEEQDKDEETSSVWRTYVDSPFLSVKFHFFTSCQVTREHMFWSIKSASLTEPKVAQVKHRVCLVQLLQEVGMLSVKSSKEGSSAQRQRRKSHRARLLDRRTQRGSSRFAETRRQGRNSMSSAFSDHETMFSRASFAETNDDFDHLSESMHSGDADSYDHVDREDAVGTMSNNGIEAFEEENSDDEEDSDEDGDDFDAEIERYEMASVDESCEQDRRDEDDSAEMQADESMSEDDNAAASQSEELPRRESAPPPPLPPTTTGVLHKQTSVFF
ncbi:hypothetical protein Gpo141_00001389 [Globisporangium polare]